MNERARRTLLEVNDDGIRNASNIVEVRPELSIKLREEIDFLKLYVQGQDHIIEAVVRQLASKIRNPNKPHQPKNRFMFFGPTGVGKSELATAITALQYLKYMGRTLDIGNVDPTFTDSQIGIDCGLHQEGHEISALLGAPPSFIGRDQKPTFCKIITQEDPPVLVVLFDEIEKSRGIEPMLLSIMEEGKLTLLNQSHGSTVTFEDIIIICTSNAGSRDMAEHALQNSRGRIGFGNGGQEHNSSSNTTDLLIRSFSPEFIGRFNIKAQFEPLNIEMCFNIASDVLYPQYAYQILDHYRIGLTMSPKRFKPLYNLVMMQLRMLALSRMRLQLM
jgi:ATP-dependent Clp protease ATP-binding subunit ClpA